jgi:NAD(P)-dependent dehydrogenase (short-subunit alcohol dehydrogenase family)
MFDVEYWPLEQLKLGARKELPLEGQIVAVTGAAGAIGAATAKTFAAAGAAIALLDVNLAAASQQAEALGATALPLACDVTDAASVNAAFDNIAAHFGGVDIVVSNAGAAWQGRIGEVGEDVLRKSFELNFYGHQRVAQAAVKIMLAQGTGGCLLFNVSKQAVNPGPNFGPYGIPKAALMALMRQYALDYGADGIRSNAVNADRIRTALFAGGVAESRAKARGVAVDDYFKANLLSREVKAEDVADAFVYLAQAKATTGCIVTVDGGNAAAFPR